MRHKSKNKTRPLFTLSLEMTRLVNETRLLLVPGVNSDIYGRPLYFFRIVNIQDPLLRGCPYIGFCTHLMTSDT